MQKQKVSREKSKKVRQDSRNLVIKNKENRQKEEKKISMSEQKGKSKFFVSDGFSPQDTKFLKTCLFTMNKAIDTIKTSTNIDSIEEEERNLILAKELSQDKNSLTLLENYKESAQVTINRGLFPGVLSPDFKKLLISLFIYLF
jgi:hypothetical protein